MGCEEKMSLTPQDHKRIREVVNQACKDAFKLHQEMGDESPFANEAINWGDLHFADIVTAVQVEEASPSAANLAIYIQEQLDKAGYTRENGYDLEVTTEW